MACVEGILQLFTNFYLHKKFSIFLRNNCDCMPVGIQIEYFFSHVFCMSLVLILRVFLKGFIGDQILYRESSQYFLRNDHDCKVVDPHFFIKKVLDIFEKWSCRKFGSCCFCKIKKPNENFLKSLFNKKICTKLSLPPQQKNWHNCTTELYAKYLRNTIKYFPPEPKKTNTTPQLYGTLST